MTADPFVLIVSTKADIATDHVIQGLHKCGIPHLRINTEEFPFSRTIGLSLGEAVSISLDGQNYPNPSATWYRRIRSPAQPKLMQEGVFEFCIQENRAALTGSLLSQKTRWMSHPANIWLAEVKPYQLVVAKQAGLPIPKTLVTNDPIAIRNAFKTFGPMVVKACRSGYVVVDGTGRSIYTSRLLEEHLEYLQEAQLSPAIYQELIPKRFDIRATIVGNQIFAAAIDSQTDPAAAIDWRHTTNPNLPHLRIDLPPKVQKSLLKLMAAYGLTFGAIDLIQTHDDEFVFLEINPNGQWLWIDDQLQLGITDAIVNWLAQT